MCVCVCVSIGVVIEVVWVKWCGYDPLGAVIETVCVVCDNWGSYRSCLGQVVWL